MLRRWAACVVVVLFGTAGGVACTTPIPGDGVNTCPGDMSLWGPLRGGQPTRGEDFYRQADNGVTDPSFYLPQQVVADGEQWTFGYDTTVEAESGSARVRIAVDWYSTPWNDNSGWIGQEQGPWVDVPVGSADPTTIRHSFTAPADAVRANVLTHLQADSADNTWTGRNCNYQRDDGSTTTTGSSVTATTEPPTTTEPSTTTTTEPPTTTVPSTTTTTAVPPGDSDTAAERHGWGNPLPEWSDEFDYGSEPSPAVPDQTKWHLAGGGVDRCWPGHAGNGQRCDKNTRVVGGILRQVGQANGDSGFVASRFGQRYGRWEVRVRSQATSADNGRQYHPLLILWPDSNVWPQDGEYDFLENSSPGEQCAEAFMHYPHEPSVPTQQEFAQRCGVDLTQWHSFAIEWTPEHLKGFVDGEEWFSFSGGASSVRECIQCAPSMHQTIQLDNFSGGTMQTAIYEVDWARVYPLG
jgi:hypothetical protein